MTRTTQYINMLSGSLACSQGRNKAHCAQLPHHIPPQQHPTSTPQARPHCTHSHADPMGCTVIAASILAAKVHVWAANISAVDLSLFAQAEVLGVLLRVIAGHSSVQLLCYKLPVGCCESAGEQSCAQHAHKCTAGPGHYELRSGNKELLNDLRRALSKRCGRGRGCRSLWRKKNSNRQI